MKVLDIAIKLFKDLKENGGASVAADGSEPTEGYMVSIEGDTRQFYGVSEDYLQSQFILYVTDYIDILRTHPSYYFGVWQDEDNTIYLDISVNLLDRAEACSKGADNNQLGIYDIENDITLSRIGSSYYNMEELED